jgi:hypothetical protein
LCGDAHDIVNKDLALDFTCLSGDLFGLLGLELLIDFS